MIQVTVRRGQGDLGFTTQPLLRLEVNHLAILEFLAFGQYHSVALTKKAWVTHMVSCAMCAMRCADVAKSAVSALP